MKSHRSVTRLGTIVGLFHVLLAATPAWGQKARPVEGMSEAQRTDYNKLMRGYVDTFRIMGRAKACRLDFDAAALLREVAFRHGENSEAVQVAELGFAAGAENRRLAPELEPVMLAPMPCDVVLYMREMRLPELPATLVSP
jgi:hypothetical protein